MLDEVKSWLKTQHIWLQSAAYILQSKHVIEESDISELVDLIKRNSEKEVKLRFPLIEPTINKKIKLHSIGPIVGIDKLNPRKPLDFGLDNLCVIYGQNGSGKSGIVRILKNICGKPHSPPLRSNVFSESPIEQSCVIKYSINDQPVKEEKWLASDKELEELSFIDIYDSINGAFYLEKETEVTYIPQELMIFTELVNICEKVKKILIDEKEKKISKLPKLPDKYIFTTWAEKYNNLTYNIAQKKLNELLTFTKEDEINLKTLQERLSNENPAEAAKTQRMIKEQLDILKTYIEKSIIILSQDSLNNFQLKLDDSVNKRKNVVDGAKQLKSMTILDGIGTDTWKELWSAAREYSNLIYNEFPYIGENARCPLCQQVLDNDTKNRLQSLESFIRGKLENDALIAERQIEEAINLLPTCPSESMLKTIYQLVELDNSITNEISSFIEIIEKTFINIRAKSIPSFKTLEIPDVSNLLNILINLCIKADEKAIQFDKDSEGIDRHQEEKNVRELEAKQWISQQNEAVKEEISRLLEIYKYDQWEKLTTTNAISRESSIISEKIITASYVTRFNEELEKLGASRSVFVELVKTGAIKGKVKHEIRLRNPVTPDASVIDVLSDGEKRIVSLAAFLADVTGNDIDTPFIFDDPISSLDQEYEEKTIERLIELSKTRQVIIFTHRLSFLSIIDDKAKGINKIHICRTPWGTTGESDDYSIDIGKPDKVLNNLKVAHIAQARKAFNEQDLLIYSVTITSICSNFRKLIERFVEIVLLADVVQRHRRAVHTYNKIHNLAKIEKADCDFIDKMMSKYSCYEHSQSKEATLNLPTLEELEADMDQMINWHNEFSRRTT